MTPRIDLAASAVSNVQRGTWKNLAAALVYALLDVAAATRETKVPTRPPIDTMRLKG